MIVKRTGRAVYEVSSDSEEDPHHVDLEENGGVGQCSCSDYVYRCYPNLRKMQILERETFIFCGPHRTMCKHILAAIADLLKENSQMNHKTQI